uniref:Insulin-like growth factor-binding protein 3 n=1 Tax=Nothobranchius rachovii TaxID=451742 RepID=A0A1A8QYZ7_9TELE
MPALCVLSLAIALAAFARLADAVGPVVRCKPCHAGALLHCNSLPQDCAEMVREPGCGCCMTCALGEGQACGVYTARCGSNLTCRQQPGESRPLQALLEGRGVCTSAASKKLNAILIPAKKTRKRWEPSRRPCQHDPGVPPAPVTVKDGRSQGSTNTRPPMNNKLLQKAENKKTQSYKVDPVSRGPDVDMHNFSQEIKRETEYGPCRRQIDSILNSLKINNVLNPRGFRIPNCDRKGFYKKKQCRPSKGRRRGVCWCVDKYGHPLPGYDDGEQGKMKCYNLESK